jgi:hypothetical protein
MIAASTFFLVQIIGNVILWAAAWIAFAWDRRAQTLTSYGLSLFAFCTAASFSGFGLIAALRVYAP